MMGTRNEKISIIIQVILVIISMFLFFSTFLGKDFVIDRAIIPENVEIKKILVCGEILSLQPEGVSP